MHILGLFRKQAFMYQAKCNAKTFNISKLLRMQIGLYNSKATISITIGLLHLQYFVQKSFIKAVITSEGFGEFPDGFLISFGERGKGWVTCVPERASVARQKNPASSDRGLRFSSAISFTSENKGAEFICSFCIYIKNKA